MGFPLFLNPIKINNMEEKLKTVWVKISPDIDAFLKEKIAVYRSKGMNIKKGVLIANLLKELMDGKKS